MSSTFNGAIATMLGAQYAGTPTGIGPALPHSYYTRETDLIAAHEEARERALCDVDSIVDWLASECMGKVAFDGGAQSRYTQVVNAERKLRTAYLNAGAMTTPDLLALALGLTSNDQARIAAMNELAERAGVVA